MRNQLDLSDDEQDGSNRPSLKSTYSEVVEFSDGRMRRGARFVDDDENVRKFATLCNSIHICIFYDVHSSLFHFPFVVL